MDTSTNTERQMENGQELKDYHAYMEWLNANDRCDFQDSGERLRTAFLDALKYERANAASPPSLHIGMGESDIIPLAEATFETIYHCKPRLEGSDTLRVVNIADGIRTVKSPRYRGFDHI